MAGFGPRISACSSLPRESLCIVPVFAIAIAIAIGIEMARHLVFIFIDSDSEGDLAIVHGSGVTLAP
jgi:hypothetical protein